LQPVQEIRAPVLHLNALSTIEARHQRTHSSPFTGAPRNESRHQTVHLYPRLVSPLALRLAASLSSSLFFELSIVMWSAVISVV
jgi:hypothetical protein